MIDVPELDLYLKTFYYVFNAQNEIYNSVDFSDELKSWITHLFNNQGALKSFEDTVEKDEFNFHFDLGRANSMYGQREIRGLADPCLLLPAPFLKVYPRLLYSTEFLDLPDNFDNFRYFFRYYPKMVVKIHDTPEGEDESLRTSQHWVIGSHTQRDSENWISYNVACEVGLNTIIEEELHAQIDTLHGTNTVQEVLQSIDDSLPQLREEIELNLNRILSTEEKKFSEVGDVLRVENASELRLLETFIHLFESEVIESADSSVFFTS